jgi:hypothetical protein
MSKSNREIPHIIGKKIDLTKALAWLQKPIINVPSKTAPRCPSYKGNSDL